MGVDWRLCLSQPLHQTPLLHRLDRRLDVLRPLADLEPGRSHRKIRSPENDGRTMVRGHHRRLLDVGQFPFPRFACSRYRLWPVHGLLVLMELPRSVPSGPTLPGRGRVVRAHRPGGTCHRRGLCAPSLLARLYRRQHAFARLLPLGPLFHRLPVCGARPRSPSHGFLHFGGAAIIHRRLHDHPRPGGSPRHQPRRPAQSPLRKSTLRPIAHRRRFHRAAIPQPL